MLMQHCRYSNCGPYVVRVYIFCTTLAVLIHRETELITILTNTAVSLNCKTNGSCVRYLRHLDLDCDTRWHQAMASLSRTSLS